MASSILSVDVGATLSTEAENNGEALTSILPSCANDPDFAVICAFLQKFSKDLGLEMPNIKQLQEWLTKTDEVCFQLRDLHIKLLRKTRKTVHEKSWESALSKFCFTYSAQDAWEIERFGYKNSSIKVKLRILRELLESQFERNMKFRAKILTINADSLRSQPIGRDRLGHAYWMTQDNYCNFRIYQEHLDEEIWQVVATNRDEFVNLITRLRGNEVVLPSADIGITDEDTSSNTSSSITQDEDLIEQQQEWKQKIPNIRIKINNSTSDAKVDKQERGSDAKENNEGSKADDSDDDEDQRFKIENVTSTERLDNTECLKNTQEKSNLSMELAELDIKQDAKSSETTEQCISIENTTLTDGNKRKSTECTTDSISTAFMEYNENIMCKKSRLSPDNNDRKSKRYAEENKQYDEERNKDKEDEEEVKHFRKLDGVEKLSGEKPERNDCEEEVEEEDIDSAAAEEDENEEKEIEEFDEDEEEDSTPKETIEEGVLHVHGSGSGMDCEAGNWLSGILPATDEGATTVVEDTIEDDPLYICGEGSGKECLVGNESTVTPSTPVSPNSLHESQRHSPEVDDIKLSAKQNESTVLERTPSKSDTQKDDVKNENKALENNEVENCEMQPTDTSIISETEHPEKGAHDTQIETTNHVEQKNCSESETALQPLVKQSVCPENATEEVSSTSKEKMLESIKKELRESKQKSLESSIQMLKENNTAATVTAKVLPRNRKRRLDDRTVQSNNSESDVDFNSENSKSLSLDKSDFDDAGGKRLKRRGKQTNLDLRKKIEAQKVAAAKTDTTSSSGGEEEHIVYRKLLSPKKHDKNLGITTINRKPVQDTTSDINCTEKKTSTNVKLVLEMPPAQVDAQNNLEPQIDCHEVIEKDDKETTEIILSSVDASLLKKPFITKPLKKTLLTQLQQQETENEGLTKKQTTSTTSTTKTNCPSPENNQTIQTGQNENVTKMTDKVSEESKHKEECVDEEDKQIQLTIAKEMDTIKEEESNPKEETTNAVNNHGDVSLNDSIKGDTYKFNEKIMHESQPATINRRSGRRSGGAVLYTELPQAKRTRSVVKNVQKSIKATKLQRGVSATETSTLESNMVKESCNEKFEMKEKSDSRKVNESSVKNKEEEEEEITDEIIPIKSMDEGQANVKGKNISEEKEDIIVHTADSKMSNETNINTLKKAFVTPALARGKGSRKKSEVDALNIIDSTDAETPVRQSRRIAQQKIREEAERRKLEEIALRTMKQELKKKKKAEKQADPTVLEPSEASSDSEESVADLKRRTQKRKCPGKNGSWSSDSDDQEEPDDEEDEEPHHYETDPGSPLFRSDHEFSPESDLEDETQIVPMKRARTVRKEDAITDEDDGGDEEEACQKCGKSDHPEWILLCDNCDKGYHCSCLSPVLFYIPEGDWYCPPCQQMQLIEALEQQLQEFDNLVLLKKEEEEEKRLADEKNRVEIEIAEERNSDESDDSLGSHDNGNNKCKNNEETEPGRTSSRTNRRRRRAKYALSETDSQDLSESSSKSKSSSSYSDSDNEPIYKLRKRRQINVSYRLNEYDDLINSALKKEMDEATAARSLGRGKDITTIIEADKEEKARQRQLELELEEKQEAAENEMVVKQENITDVEEAEGKEAENNINSTLNKINKREDDDSDIESKKRRIKPKSRLRKKSRKLTKLDISSEDDDASDEDFKTSSFDEDDDEEDTTNSTSSDRDSMLEVCRHRGQKKSHQRKSARRSMRERRKDRKFVIEDSDEDEDDAKLSTLKKKSKRDTDYTESEIDDEYDLSELSENINSADLCDDTTSEETDGAWRPNKRKKNSKHFTQVRNSLKSKKCQAKKQRKVEYSDDDISESEEEDNDGCSGKGSGKQPRSQPVAKPNVTTAKQHGGSGKVCLIKNKKKLKSSAEEFSFSDSGDSTRRTRGRRYAYIEDFDDDSSDGGIKPGVQRPDTPPEEREKFIKRQEEIKRMLAEKNAEGAKMAATPRLTPIKSNVEKVGIGGDKRSPVKQVGGDSLSTVPISVIRQAKVLDVDYLQRKGETLNDLENDDVDNEDVDDFDDADLPDDLPEDMDEDAIARMVEEEEEEEFGAVAARELPAPDDVLKISNKGKVKEEKPMALVAANINLMTTTPCAMTITATSTPPIASTVTTPANILTSNLQEPIRKRLPMPTTHPPLLRHQFPPQNSTTHMLPRTQHGPASLLLQNALSAPLSQPLPRNYPFQTSTTQPDLIDRLNHGMSLMASTSRHIHGKSSSAGPHFVAAARTTKDMHTPLHSKMQHALLTNQSMPPIALQHEAKPRGRRKKITPLRDTLQKQQAAAAVTAAAATNSSISSNKPIATSDGCSRQSTKMTDGVSVIKDAMPLSSSSLHTSVITTLSHLSHAVPVSRPPPPSHHRPMTTIPPYTATDVFYASAANRSALMGTRHRASSHNLPSSLLQPHSAVSVPYGPPPPLRGTPGSPSNHNTVTSIAGNMHTRFSTSASLTAAREHQLPSYICTSTRPPGPNINPYRPQIYNNPSFGPRLVPPPTSNLRRALPPTHGVAYSMNPRTFPPYVYYPPPPPLTSPMQSQPPQRPPPPPAPPVSNSTLTQAPMSSTSTSVIVIAPPAVPSIIVSSSHSLIGDNCKSPTVLTKAHQSKSSSPDRFINDADKSITSQSTKKLTTLDTYTNTTAAKLPLPLNPESLTARNSPGVQTDPPGDSSSSHGISENANADPTTEDKDREGSEFSGLVSYFSSQHSDYNT